MSKRGRKKKRNKRHANVPMDISGDPEALRIHRELEMLRAAGLTRQRKPSAVQRSNGRAKGHRNRAWLKERGAKWLESRREK
jgi:hypothetical protein